MLPDHCSMYIASIEDAEYKNKKLDFWDGVGYDIDMTCIKPSVLSEPLIDVLPSKYINSNTCKIFEIDLYTIKKEDLEFSSAYELTITRNDSFSGLVGWFDCEFSKLNNKVKLSTSPFTKSTHWKQTTFYSEKDVNVSRGDIVKGSIAVRKSLTNFRELDVKISYHFKGIFNEVNFIQQYKIR